MLLKRAASMRGSITQFQAGDAKDSHVQVHGDSMRNKSRETEEFWQSPHKEGGYYY